jgi:ABC-type antimicrobial peptide transport system permease subunit
MVVLSSATAGMDKMMEETLAAKASDIEIKEYNKAAALSQLPSNITDIIEMIPSTEHIEVISPEIYCHGFEQFGANISLPDLIQLSARGVNHELDQQLDGPTTDISSGRIYENEFEIIVADFVANAEPTIFKINNEIDFIINSSYKLNLTITGIFDTVDGPVRFLNPVFLMSVDTAITINDLYLPFSQEGYNLVRVRFDTKDNSLVNNYAAEIELLEPKMSVTLLGEGIESASNVMDTFDTFSILISIVSIMAGGMAIIVAQLMGVNERMKEFAIMKATGWKNRTIFVDIVLESLVIGLLGALTGFAFGVLLIVLVEHISSRSFVIITWQIVLTVIGFGVGLGLLGGLIPGYHASRIKPMEVIRGA